MSDRLTARRPPQFLAATVAAFMTVGLASGCSSEEEQYVHCIDENGQVVDPELCEDEEYDDDYDTHYWYYLSRSRYGLGSTVPSDYRSTRIDPADETRRANAGLARTGRVGGTTVRSGGFGSGSGGKSGGGLFGGAGS